MRLDGLEGMSHTLINIYRYNLKCIFVYGLHNLLDNKKGPS